MILCFLFMLNLPCIDFLAFSGAFGFLLDLLLDLVALIADDFFRIGAIATLGVAIIALAVQYGGDSSIGFCIHFPQN